MRYLHERIRVVAPWSSYLGRAGEVTQVEPYVMVLLDGERVPVRVGEREIIGEQSERHVGGAE